MRSASLNVSRYIALIGLLMTWFGSPAWSVDQELCMSATSIPLNGTLRRADLIAGIPHLFVLDIPSPGTVMAEIASPGSDAHIPDLLFLGEVSSQPEHNSLLDKTEYAWFSPQSQLLTVYTPGLYCLAVIVADEGSAHHVSNYRLTTRFIDEAIQPESFSNRPACVCDKSGDEDTDIDEELSEIISSKLGNEGSVNNTYYVIPASLRSALCGREDVDDHGDSIFCATQVTLGKPEQGELRNSWHDDHDFLTFTLGRVQQVRIESSGAVDTIGSLYSSSGHRLTAINGGGHGANFRIIQTLGPGRYFVRVEGSYGDEGVFNVVVEQLKWGHERLAQ